HVGADLPERWRASNDAEDLFAGTKPKRGRLSERSTAAVTKQIENHVLNNKVRERVSRLGFRVVSRQVRITTLISLSQTLSHFSYTAPNIILRVRKRISQRFGHPQQQLALSSLLLGVISYTREKPGLHSDGPSSSRRPSIIACSPE
ncbi:unnamed protein product, partial [Ectocarpus sp. 13 AM-2016]